MRLVKNKIKDPLWTKDFIIHCASYLMIFCGFYFLLPALPIFVVSELGEDKGQVGLITGIYAISALIIRPFAGYAFDVYGRKRVYLVSLILYIFTMAAYFLATSFFILLVVRVIQGISWGVITTGGGTVTADLVPDTRRGEGIGFFGLSITLSMAIGPMIGLWVLGDNHFNFLFAASVVIAIVGFVLANFINYSKIRAKAKRISWDTVFEIKVIHISVVILIAAIPFAGIMSFLPLLGDELNIESIGLFFLIYALGVGILRPFAGTIMDIKGPGPLMLVSFVLSIGGLVLLSFSASETIFLWSGFIIGLGNGIVMPTLQTMLVNMVPAERRGVATSTFYSAVDLGIGFGSVALGYIAELTSLSTMYLVSGLLLLGPAIYFFIIVINHYYRVVKALQFGN
ncbi:MFS transporter [Fulvivirgaceae bacterium BMA10]|uniref:MFS transporter n=1 Tax=Splendidivirga corallicola TaxID=3051826 RepID=A0ABT8KGC5_9BACT|nr:MFS transporter [Fulvivirgaceae bacterium BMA10]